MTVLVIVCDIAVSRKVATNLRKDETISRVAQLVVSDNMVLVVVLDDSDAWTLKQADHQTIVFTLSLYSVIDRAPYECFHYKNGR